MLKIWYIFVKFRLLIWASNFFLRWDINAIDQLPEYMKLCYRALIDVYNELEKDLASQGKLYRLHYAKEAVSTPQYFIKN